MQKIKVLLASRPKMLSDVIRNMLERQPDMEVIGEVLDPIELLLTAKARPVDVVIVTPLDAEGEPSICRHLHRQETIPMPTTTRTKCYVHEMRQPLELPYEPYKYHLCLLCQIRLLEIAKTDFRFECSKQVVKISIQPELHKKAA